MAGTVIACVCDEQDFAKGVYDYLYAELERQANFKDGKSLQVTAQLVRLFPDSNEIEIDERAQVPGGMVKWILKKLLESDAARFKDYGIIQFEDTFTVSKLVQTNDLGIYSCELCNYSTLYEEELYHHRTLHAGFG